MSYGPWDCKILKQTHITEGKHGVAITCNITIKKIKRPWQMSLQGTCVRNMHASSCAAIMYQQLRTKCVFLASYISQVRQIWLLDMYTLRCICTFTLCKQEVFLKVFRNTMIQLSFFTHGNVYICKVSPLKIYEAPWIHFAWHGNP